jgi:hypothetical protein
MIGVPFCAVQPEVYLDKFDLIYVIIARCHRFVKPALQGYNEQQQSVTPTSRQKESRP